MQNNRPQRENQQNLGIEKYSIGGPLNNEAGISEHKQITAK
jgi:hypothetical protein